MGEMGEVGGEKAELVIFDLDGTLLDTERVIQQVVRCVVEELGGEYSRQVAMAGMGKRPLEATKALIEAAGLTCSPEEVMSKASAQLMTEWSSAELMPGAERLLRHLHAAGVNMALATSTPLEHLPLKLGPHPVLREVFSVMVAGDEVPGSKPAPDIFQEAMRRAKVTDPSKCLVIEDAPAGVQAAKAAKMPVVAVPSVLDVGRLDKSNFSASNVVLSCLLDFRPENFGLPPFDDFIGEVVPIEPWRVKGPVVKGFGRGSKLLGIPTANLPPSSWDGVEGGVPALTSGIYCGWSSVGNDSTVYPTALSVGWNPHFDEVEDRGTSSHTSSGKTLEPWLLHEFDTDFYDEELRLVVCGYIRPEAPFTTMEALVERIHEDGRASLSALETAEAMRGLARDHYLLPRSHGWPKRNLLAVTTALAMCTLTVCVASGDPETSLPPPFDAIRAFGVDTFESFDRLLQVCTIAWTIHFCEALVGLAVAWRKGLALPQLLVWWLLAFLCGFPILRNIFAIPPQRSSLEGKAKNTTLPACLLKQQNSGEAECKKTN